MGLRHRTPMSALREQRRRAGQNRTTSFAVAPSYPRKASRVRLTPFTPLGEPSRLTWSAGPLDALPVPEKCQMLLARLRASLQPLDRADRLASDAAQSEYKTLQDEIQRLAEHTSLKRAVLAQNEDFCRELMIPMSFQGSSNAEDAPYRSFKIDVAVPAISQNLQQLQRAPGDLSLYQKPSQRERGLPPMLSLVVKSAQPVESTAAQDLIDTAPSDAEHSSDVANLMQRNLHLVRSRATELEIPNDVILSLLEN